jgi:hypothetical protein
MVEPAAEPDVGVIAFVAALAMDVKALQHRRELVVVGENGAAIPSSQAAWREKLVVVAGATDPSRRFGRLRRTPAPLSGQTGPAAATAAMRPWSAGWRGEIDRITALGEARGCGARSRHAGLRVQGSFLLDVGETGVAPRSATTSAVAAKVKVGQMTASPAPMPLARSTISNASVPLAQLTA